MTQLEYARKGIITPQMKTAARREGASAETVRKEVAAGRAVIAANSRHKNLVPVVIGRRFGCKINANLGNSGFSTHGGEIKKLLLAVEWGADAVMDLSTSGDLRKLRRAFVRRSPVPVGTVPVYEALLRAGTVEAITPELLLQVIREHAEDGVDFMTVHAGILRKHIPFAKTRVMGIVSRGGAILAKWMSHRRSENPLYTHFTDICRIFREYDVTFSLGDALRPGCLADACDRAQYAELETLGELVAVSRKSGAQAMVEGPGHVPLDQIPGTVKKALRVCHDAPFYVLGPLVTDIAAGYDHINAAIGAAQAARHGASFLCYVTPKEHVGFPDCEDVRQGIMALRTAAHAADIARGLEGARRRDDEMSKARYAMDWKRQFALALDPGRAREYRFQTITETVSNHCAMCGPKFCSVKNSREACGR